MKNGFVLSVKLGAAPEVIYKAWLSSKEHARFTGTPAKITPRVGGKFTAGDGYITGRTIALTRNRKILQQWRTVEFPEASPDSRLELTFKPSGNGTILVMKHTGIPRGQVRLYREGWKDFYFKPMRTYFSSPIRAPR